MKILYECGICDCLHPWDFQGDCRDNNNRYADAEDYAERHNISEYDIDVLEWEERLEADQREELLSPNHYLPQN